MSQTRKAPCFRGHVRKSVSFGVTSWVSEIRTRAAFTDLGLTPTVGQAIALAIQTASAPAAVLVEAHPQPLPLRQAA